MPQNELQESYFTIKRKHPYYQWQHRKQAKNKLFQRTTGRRGWLVGQGRVLEVSIYCIYTFLNQFLQCLIEFIIKSQEMDFFCSLFKPEQHHVEVYSFPPRSRSRISDPFIETGSSRNFNPPFPRLPQEHPIHLAYAVPVYRADTLTTIDEPRAYKLKSNPNPEHLNYSLIDTLAVPKDGLVNLLRNKEKMIQGGAKGAENIVMRLVKKSDYQQKASSNYNGKKWQDQSFPPSPTYNIKNQQNQVVQLDWPSLQDLCKMMKKNCCFMDNDLNPTDIVQGSVGDCYFLSAVAALIRKTERVPRLFPANCKINQNGVYMAQMMFKGILQEVMVDERFPVDKAKNKLLGCTSNRQVFEIYGMVLEKCWAKLWKSYENIDGGFPNQALHALTGAPAKNYILENETARAQLKQSFFQQVLRYSQVEFVMCAGTYSDIRMMKISGDRTVKLPQNHIFCVEYFYEDPTNKQKMVRLYNPWGVNWTNGADITGQIDAPWQEFIANFQYLTVCKAKDSANYLFTQLQGCKRGEFKFIELIVNDPKDGQIAISLSQTDRKKPTKQDPYLMTTFFAIKCVSDAPNAKYQYVSIRTNYEHPDHYFELSKVTPGKYIIGMYFSEVEVKEKLTFGVYSEAIFGLKEIDLDQKSQLSMLEQAFIGYQSTNPADSKREYLFGKDKDVWYSFNVMCNNSNFGYLMLHVGKNEKSCQIAMGRNAVTSTKLTMWKPYDSDKICLKGEPGTDKIVFMTVDKLLEYRGMDQKFIDKKTRYHIKNILISKS